MPHWPACSNTTYMHPSLLRDRNCPPHFRVPQPNQTIRRMHAMCLLVIRYRALTKKPSIRNRFPYVAADRAGKVASQDFSHPAIVVQLDSYSFERCPFLAHRRGNTQQNPVDARYRQMFLVGDTEPGLPKAKPAKFTRTICSHASTMFPTLYQPNMLRYQSGYT